MRMIPATIVLALLCALGGFAAATATKATAKQKVVPGKSATPKAGATKAGTAKSGNPVSARSKLAKTKSTKKAPAATWRTRQQSPTPERYKEIQQALIDKGYLKGEPTGVWDADSSGAMGRFQADQKLQPTGKINAPSLIGLGLGAKSAGASEAPPLVTAPRPTPEPAPSGAGAAPDPSNSH